MFRIYIQVFFGTEAASGDGLATHIGKAQFNQRIGLGEIRLVDNGGGDHQRIFFIGVGENIFTAQ